MTTRSAIRTTMMGLLLMTGCSSKTAVEPMRPAESPAPGAPGADAVRPALTTAECEAKGGQVVGDIGDGAIHRPEYRCVSGVPPIADIRPSEGEPVAVEGSVCCPDAA